ncbi:MAG: clan AA aspartic protease [Deltaproteobacteria bacterium]|nr:clan AA aspartic protease [Deltaproteobacteria bacterium]
MGFTYVTVEVKALHKNKPKFSDEFMVDTGAIDCLIPGKILKKLGIPVAKTLEYEMADGSLHKYPVGFARIEFMGEETVTQVVFGPDDCEPLLGVVALENTGYGVDPITKTLRKMNARPLK